MNRMEKIAGYILLVVLVLSAVVAIKFLRDFDTKLDRRIEREVEEIDEILW